MATIYDSLIHTEHRGATHLMGLQADLRTGAWRPSCPEIIGYYADGTVYFRRSDTGTWDIISAQQITPEMATALPAAEQERIKAHAKWFSVWDAVTDTDDMGRTTPAARKAGRQLKKWEAECATMRPALTRFIILDTAAGVALEDGYFPTAREALETMGMPSGGWQGIEVKEYETGAQMEASQVVG